MSFKALALIAPAVSLALASSVWAQTGNETARRDCASDSYHQFDFWLGEWDFYYRGGPNAVGHSLIQVEEGGCLITEHSVGTNGSTYQNILFFNSNTNLWRQVWVGRGFIIDQLGGLTETGSMKMEGTISYQRSGSVYTFIGEWTPNADGSVSLQFEQYDAQVNAWVIWWTGRYVRSEN